MPTMDMEIFDMNSEEPLAAAFIIYRPCHLVRPSLKREVFGSIKYTSGITPPTAIPVIVAYAAQASPSLKTPISSQSRNMFVTPAATVTYSPSFGFSTVIKKLWNTYCKVKGIAPTKQILAY